MIRIVTTLSHEYHLEQVDDGYVCRQVKIRVLNDWETTRIGQKVKIEDNRLCFEDGEETTKIQEG